MTLFQPLFFTKLSAIPGRANDDVKALVFSQTAICLNLKFYLGLKILSWATGIVRYHIEGSMKLNARILLLAHMVYLKPKHNLLLAQ
jgi:hypothetical protein